MHINEKVIYQRTKWILIRIKYISLLIHEREKQERIQTKSETLSLHESIRIV